MLFFVLTGSSLDLTPSLMTIYDNLAEDDAAIETSNKCVTLAVVEPHQPGPGHVGTRDNVTYSRTEKMTSSSTTNMSQESTTSSLISEECDDGDPAELISGGSDAKKRPLSVSSTSSSSTSSLPRHQRKKIASMVTSPIASLNNPLAMMDCGINNSIVSPGNCSSVTPEGAMEMDVTSDDEDDNATTRGSGDNCNVTDAKEDNCAKSDLACMVSSDQCVGLDQVSCHEHLQESRERISFDNNNADGKLCYIEKVVTEILETERTYVRDLEEIIQVSFSS